MLSKKSPGGSIFPYPFKGGELCGLHCGSFGKDEEALLKRMRGEEQFIADSNYRLPMWIEFYQSKLTDRVLIELLQMVRRLHGHVTRLALAGFSLWDRRRLTRLAKKLDLELDIPLRFFEDPEVAKAWLVSEGG